MRWGKLLQAVALTGLWAAALFGLGALDADNGYAYAIGGVILTLALGAWVDSWWLLLAPIGISAVYLTWFYLTDTPCTDCSEEDPAGLAIFLVTVLFTLPAIACIIVGVAARRAGRFFRRLET
jgi:hypothetical protein